VLAPGEAIFGEEKIQPAAMEGGNRSLVNEGDIVCFTTGWTDGTK